MSPSPAEPKGILKASEIDLSDTTTAVSSSSLSQNIPKLSHQRHGYRRMDSQGSVRFSPNIESAPEDTPYSTIPLIVEGDSNNSANMSQGLGISRVSTSASRKSPSPPSPSSGFYSPPIGSGSLMASPATSQNRLLPSPSWSENNTYGEGGGYSGQDQRHTRNESLNEEDISKGKISAFTESLDMAFDGPNISRLNSIRGTTVHDEKHIGCGCAANNDIHSRVRSWTNSDGVTVAELTMRNWVIQPGFMLTNPKILRRAAMSILGGITLTAAFVAMFYTTASDAIVSPSLQFGKWESVVMKGLVKTSYGNPTYVGQNCQTPISTAMDQLYSASTCVDIDHAGEAYHNFLEYLRTWAEIAAPGGKSNSSELAHRPNVTAMLYDNTTVKASWIRTDTSDMAASYKKYNRVVNNVTLAMPHSGVISAATDQVNSILQPSDLEGVGEYKVRASVVSPTINVLCANMNKTELSPIIYVDWPNAVTIDSTNVPNQKLAWAGYTSEIFVEPGQEYLNSTVVDDIFGWGTNGKQPPVFPMLPIDYNIISNISVYMSGFIYVLAKSSITTDYTICEMSSFLATDCSTKYSAAGSGGILETTCEDPNDELAYAKSYDPPPPPPAAQTDFRNIISEWALTLSLNTGISNDNASISRLLTQFVPTTPSLNTTLPSLAEALASLAGCTLLISAQDATFRHYMGYTAPDDIVSPGIYEPFNASISSQSYTSGPAVRWQNIFYVVLLLVFLTNLFCLGYFIRQRGLVTDFTETQNLFALAVNSPPSQRLGGSCGAGPQGDQLNVDFHVHHEENSSHFYLKEGNSSSVFEPASFELKNRKGPGMGLKSRTASSYSMLSNKRRSILNPDPQKVYIGY
ncbi:hypothetical protein SS1G_00409 [Sclerotinia sclerotiorum 1980 UF-70]|uniref:Uncharacterized protein n=1 Tax=Sclerotinia sclerotiorum (strain ATCC 18683 / 1980 / Ss-1) TaxID=665079 RepID=A7E537_SCLS1|nr:hypothetical protein SS1G_00409 [Sclerotinia sclerotiorum 1980 UF-70]EDN91009.1 hypothetical protein SS1G_00409 [Sclerotinia sclerotiorum 1980 UF-70]